MQHAFYYKSSLGKILIVSDKQGIIGLWFEGSKNYADTLASKHEEKSDKYLRATKLWLDEYFARHEPSFTPKLHLQGTAFQIKVWRELLKIPYGQLTSYQKIAEKVASKDEKLPTRAVGGAVGKNHVQIIVPCHRVVGRHGDLTGYSGGLERKAKLLKLEGIDTSKFDRPSLN